MSHRSYAGHLLVASPHLGDPNFQRTVVLMVEHDEQEALGLVLNRPSEYSIGDVWEQVTGTDSDSIEPIYVGGPCEGPIMALHTSSELGQREVLPGLWFTAHRDHLNEIVETDDTPFRLFSGYSGWGSGQLDGEMEVGGWLTTLANVKHVFLSSDEELWKAVAGEIGDDILRADSRIRIPPGDVSLN